MFPDTINFSIDKESSTYFGIVVGVSIFLGLVIGGIVYRALT